MGVIKNEASPSDENTPSNDTKMGPDEADQQKNNASSVETKSSIVLNQLNKDDMDKKHQAQGDNAADKKPSAQTKVNISGSESKQVISKASKVDDDDVGSMARQLVKCKIKDESEENIRHLKSSKKLNASCLELEDEVSKLSINDADDKQPAVRLVSKGPDGGKPVHHIQDNYARYEFGGIAHKAMPCMSHGSTYPNYDDRGNSFIGTPGKRGRDTDKAPAYKYTRPGVPFQNSPDWNVIAVSNEMPSFPSTLHQQFPQQQLAQQQIPQQQQLVRQQLQEQQLARQQLPQQRRLVQQQLPHQQQLLQQQLARQFLQQQLTQKQLPQQQSAQQQVPHQHLTQQQQQQQLVPQQLPQQLLPHSLVYDDLNKLSAATISQQQSSLVSMPTMSVNNMCGGTLTMKPQPDFENVQASIGSLTLPDMMSNVLNQQLAQPLEGLPEVDYQSDLTEEIEEILEFLGPPKIPPVSQTHGQLLPESVHAQNNNQVLSTNSPINSIDRYAGENIASSTNLSTGMVTASNRHLSGEDSGTETWSEGYRSDFSPESQFSPESNLDSPPSVMMMSPASVGSSIGMGSPQMPELIRQMPPVHSTAVPGKIQHRVGSEPSISSNQFGNHASPTSFTNDSSPMAPHSCPPPYPSHRSPYSAVRSPMSVQSFEMRSPVSISSGVATQDGSNLGSVGSLITSPPGQMIVDGVPSPQQQNYQYQQVAQQQCEHIPAQSIHLQNQEDQPSDGFVFDDTSEHLLNTSPPGQLGIDVVPSPQQQNYRYQQVVQQQGEHIPTQSINLQNQVQQQSLGFVFDDTSVKLMDDFIADHPADLLDVLHVIKDDLRMTQISSAKSGGQLSSNNTGPMFSTKHDGRPMPVSNVTSPQTSIPASNNNSPVSTTQAPSPQTQQPLSPLSVVMPTGTVMPCQPVIIGGQNFGGAMMMGQPGNPPIMMQPIPPGATVAPLPGNMVPFQCGTNPTLYVTMPVIQPQQYPQKVVAAKKPPRKILPKMFDVKDSVAEQAPPRGKPGPKPGHKNVKSLAKSIPTTVKEHSLGANVFSSSASSTHPNAAPGLPVTSGQKMSSSVAAPGGPPMEQLITTCPTASIAEDMKLNVARRCVATMTTEDLQFQDEDGDTYVHVAVCRADPHMVQAILERIQRCNLHHLIDLQNAKRQTPMYLAVAVNQPAMVKMFVQCGADANSLAQVSRNDCQGMEVKAAIHCASSGGVEYLNTLRELINSPYINLNLANSEGLTALHCAIRSQGHLRKDNCRINAIPIVELLITAGCDSNVQDKKSGKTPLMYAIESRDAYMVTLMFTLIEKPQLRQMLKTQTFDGSSCAKIASRLRGDTNPEGWQKITSLILSVGMSDNRSSPSPNSRKHNVVAVS